MLKYIRQAQNTKAFLLKILLDKKLENERFDIDMKHAEHGPLLHSPTLYTEIKVSVCMLIFTTHYFCPGECTVTTAYNVG